MVSEGGYPNRQQLTDWLIISTDADVTSLNEKQQVLQSLKQSVVQGDLEQIQDRFQLGEQIGIPKQELVNAIQEGVNERQQTTKKAVDAANELLGVSSNGCAPGSGCC